jgi:hypothetical protein
MPDILTDIGGGQLMPINSQETDGGWAETVTSSWPYSASAKMASFAKNGLAMGHHAATRS